MSEIKFDEIPEEIKQRVIDDLMRAQTDFMHDRLFGERTTSYTVPQDERGITGEDLINEIKQIADYVQPETLEVNGEKHEIHGYKVHTEFVPDGFKVLTRKKLPNEKFDLDQKEGDLIIIDEKAGKALVSKEKKFSLFDSPFKP